MWSQEARIARVMAFVLRNCPWQVRCLRELPIVLAEAAWQPITLPHLPTLHITLKRKTYSRLVPWCLRYLRVQLNSHQLLFLQYYRPQIKQDEGWGSRPVVGRDWGNSCACDAAFIQELGELLEESCRLAGNYAPCDDKNNVGLPFMPLPCLEFEIKKRPPEGRGSLASMEEVNEEPEALMRGNDQQEKIARRQRVSLAKHRRMSLWTAAAQDSVSILPDRKTTFFPRGASTLAPVEEPMTSSISNLDVEFPTLRGSISWDLDEEIDDSSMTAIHDERILSSTFAFLNQNELLCTASLVCRSWATAATIAHANMMMASIGYVDRVENDDEDIDGDEDSHKSSQHNSISLSMARDWRYLTDLYPWGCYLSAGTFKKVFKVHNTKVGRIEAVSVMDLEQIKDTKVVAAELMVSVMLSSLARRGVCPNFILTRGVITSGYAPPESHWGSMDNKNPKGAKYNAAKVRRPGKPKGEPDIGRYQLIRMELCHGGDLEEYLKVQPDKILECNMSRSALFQIAFALHAGAARFSLKHYDMKLLNVFVQKLEASHGDVVLRYGLGAHLFALRMPWDQAFIAKLADYGTANVRSESNGQPVTIAQFTTLENTPPDFMILGDLATQGHGHDNWGLGLCMLHLFTGHKPYEEIMADVMCPPMLRKRLKKVWENDNELGYTAIRSVILTDVYKDNSGHIIDGEPDETLYETLYRYLVLFGVPKGNFQDKMRPKVWKAIRESLEGVVCKKAGRGRKQCTDVDQFHRDRSLYSIEKGGNDYIKEARERLLQMEGGMDLLLSLCAFDPARRATALQVLNSPFMNALREEPNASYGVNDHVQSFTAFSTNS
jgi:serine/threonine protein kinase